MKIGKREFFNHGRAMLAVARFWEKFSAYFHWEMFDLSR